MARRVLERHTHPKYPRLFLELRSTSKFYQARCYLDSRMVQGSTKAVELPTAFKVAEAWYRKQLKASDDLATEHPVAQLTADPVVKEAYRSYLAELAGNKRAYAEQKWSPIQNFWKALRLKEIGPKTFKDFYAWRRKRSKSGISNGTLHKDTVLIRQILKHATENEQLDRLPVIPRIGKIARNPRPWLTKAEWQHLEAVSRQRIDDVRKANSKLYRQRQDLHDFIVFMLESMMRVDEVKKLRVSQIRYDPEKYHILIDAVGKTGHRTVVAKSDATEVFIRRVADGWIGKNGRLFQHHPRDAFRELLKAAGLRTDAFGVERNLKSLRPTAISFALLNGVGQLAVARNSGTSLAMIDTFYAKRLSAEMHVDQLAP